MQLLAERWTDPDKGEDRYTFDSRSPDREIDFILLWPPDRFERLHMDVLDEPMASDHRPIVLDVPWSRSLSASPRVPAHPRAGS